MLANQLAQAIGHGDTGFPTVFLSLGSGEPANPENDAIDPFEVRDINVISPSPSLGRRLPDDPGSTISNPLNRLSGNGANGPRDTLDVLDLRADPLHPEHVVNQFCDLKLQGAELSIKSLLVDNFIEELIDLRNLRFQALNTIGNTRCLQGSIDSKSASL